MPLSRPKHRFAAVVAAFLVFLLPSTAFAQAANDRVVSRDGVGPALLGSTPDELIAALGPDYEVGDEVRITVDFNGRVIRKDGEVQFRAAMTDDSDKLTLFIVSNPDYATAEGVGPSTTIADAEAIYGDATLAWNPDNEGREFVSFENGPEGRVDFRTPGIGGTNVGIYGDDEFETTDYDPEGAIAALWVSCIPGNDCPADRGVTSTSPDPTPEPTPEPTATPEATATPEPTPTPAPSTSGGGDDSLPRTGTSEIVLIAIVSTLFVLGGAFVLIERSYLCPAWLTTRR